jgi:hypothetical protein
MKMVAMVEVYIISQMVIGLKANFKTISLFMFIKKVEHIKRIIENQTYMKSKNNFR